MTTVAEYLDAKGIREQAKALGWTLSKVNGSYLQYRALNIDGEPYTNSKGVEVHRMVRWNKDAPIRFYFLPTKEEDKADVPLWYTPEGLWDAVIEQNGILRITAGESDMLSLRSVGINNVAGLYGEGNHPPDGLADYGVEMVWYYTDSDVRGQLAAVDRWWGFQQSKMPVRILRLPGKVDERPIKDVNDIWQALKFNADKMELVIRNLKHWEVDELLLDLTMRVKGDVKECQPLITAIGIWDRKGLLEHLRLNRSFDAVIGQWSEMGILPQPKLIRDQPRDFETDVPVGLWEEIERLTVGGKALTYESDGWSRERYKCPTGNHTDKDSLPAFKLNHVKYIGYCHKCGRDFLWKEMAQLLGIYEQFVHRQEPKSAPSQPAPAQPTSTATVLALPAGIRVVGWKQMADETKAEIVASSKDPKEVKGLPFGFHYFDRVTQGLLAEDLFMILARPGMGKSTFVMQAAMRFLAQVPVVIVSPEMTGKLWMQRMLDNLFGHRQIDVVMGCLKNVEQALQDVDAIYRNRKEIAYIDSNALTQEQLKQTARFYRERGFGALIVDSIQNVNAVAGDVYMNTRLTMSALEDISNHALPVLCSCQANRGSKDNPNKMPSITDAEGGGSIEQKAKRIVVVHRPYYSVEVGEQEEKEAGDPRIVLSRLYKDRFFGQSGKPFDFLLEREQAYGFIENYQGRRQRTTPTKSTTIYLNQPHEPQLAAAGLRAVEF